MHLRRNDFLLFAEGCGIPRKAAETMIRSMVNRVPQWTRMCEDSLLPPDLKKTLSALIRERAERIA